MPKGLKATQTKRNKSSRNPQSASIRGLQIQRTDTLKTQSQASVYSHRTDRTTGTTGTRYSQDMDLNEDQLDKDEMREVFVSEEEEKVIHKILEIARKGVIVESTQKINQKNAFEIPIKVADNENSNIAQTKFWKFASELLGVSISIFDKRIENTWISTNSIHDKLTRLHIEQSSRRNETEENEDQASEQDKADVVTLQIERFRDQTILESARIGEETLEDPDKLDSIKLKMQTLTDPLFEQKLKAFDNNSTKGLLLNIFTIGDSCEVELFANKKAANKRNIPISQARQNKDHLKLIQQEIATGGRMESLQILSSIKQYKKQHFQKKQNKRTAQANNPNDIPKDDEPYENQQVMKEFEDFLDTDFGNLQSQMPLYDEFVKQQEYLEIVSVQDNEVHSQADSDTNTRVTYLTQQNDGGNLLSEDGFFSYNSSSDRSFHSVMTPWELQFKQGKLQKKRRVASKKRTDQSKAPKQRIPTAEINFDYKTVELRKLVMKKGENKQASKSSKQTKIVDKNLIAPQLVVYEKMNFRKIHSRLVASGQNGQSEDNHFYAEQIPQFLAPDPSMVVQTTKEIEQNTKDGPQGEDNLELYVPDQMFKQSSQSDFSQFSLQRNIRQLKKMLLEEVRETRELRISDLDIGISPASAMITFLHMANEKNLVVRNSENEDDVILSWE